MKSNENWECIGYSFYYNISFKIIIEYDLYNLKKYIYGTCTSIPDFVKTNHHELHNLLFEKNVKTQRFNSHNESLNI